MSRLVFGILAGLLCLSVTFGQRKAVPRRYEIDEAYRVYEAILPSEESYWFAKGTLVIQLETGPQHSSPYGCLSDEANRKFRAASADFAVVNETEWVLLPKFNLHKPYKLISSDSIHRLDSGDQGSAGYIALSAVGFNKAKTLAVVFSESSCGGLCGSFNFHLLQKVKGEWKEVSGVTCAGAS